MELEVFFNYLLVAATSAIAFWFAVRRLRLRPEILQGAVRELVECVGASVVFFLINAVLGIAGVFLIRGVWRFLGFYVLTGFMLVVFSLLQGFLFQMWWRRSRFEQDGPA
jgi:hypothetical protein